MTRNQEPQFIVQLPNGRKSKPQTRAAIQQMYAAGKIPLPANVLCAGKSFAVSLDEFVSDSGLLNRLLEELPDLQESGNSKPFIEPASVFVPTSPNTGRQLSVPELPDSPTTKWHFKKTIRAIFTIAAGVLLAFLALAIGFIFILHLLTGPGSDYDKSMREALKRMNEERALRGEPLIEID